MATLSEIRKAKGFKTVDLAEELGISQGYYSNLERGKRPFPDPLLKKTAKALKLPIHTAREALKMHPHEPHTLRSWISSIKINGFPFLKAFQYYLESHEIKAHSLDDARLKKKIKEFIEENIGFSILAELSENKALLPHVRDLMSVYSTQANDNPLHTESKTTQ